MAVGRGRKVGSGGSVLIWYGDQIETLIRGRSARAIDETTQRAAARAAEITYEVFTERTGDAGRSWRSIPASDRGSLVEGSFGSFGVFYVPWLNDGTVHFEGGFMLQRAASEVFPHLAGRLNDNTTRITSWGEVL